MKKLSGYMCFAGIMLLGSPSYAQTPAPADAELYLISPRDGAKLRSPITVRFGLKNMGVTHAGDTAPNMGHHHLLVDATDPINPSEPLPSNKKYLHFGAGQTETKLELPPGNHTLQLVLGDANHKPFKPVVSSKIIHIRVLRSNADAAL
ncbi:DUF4399 domain-containing protein [Methylobacterium longum]